MIDNDGNTNHSSMKIHQEEKEHVRRQSNQSNNLTQHIIVLDLKLRAVGDIFR